MKYLTPDKAKLVESARSLQISPFDSGNYAEVDLRRIQRHIKVIDSMQKHQQLGFLRRRRLAWSLFWLEGAYDAFLHQHTGK